MEAYLGEIRMFAGSYAPQGWALCDGSLLKVSDYQALYSLIGITWGGDGVNNFALPDLRGRLPIGQGKGAALSARAIGQKDGVEQVTLTEAQMPSHTHLVNATADNATTVTPGPTVNLAATIPPAANFLPNAKVPSPAISRVLNANTIGASGGNAPHNNVMPSFVVNFIICLNGVYPMRQS